MKLVPPPNLTLIIATTICTGLSKGEILNLKWKDVDSKGFGKQ
jgi:integrase